jgi:hypothetical protein
MQSVISAATNWWADGIGSSPAVAGAGAAAATRQPPADEAEEESEDEETDGESEASESEDEEEETKGAASLAEHVKGAAESDAPFAFLPADSDLEKLVIQHHRFRRETQVSLSQQTRLHLLQGRELTSGVSVSRCQAPTNQREWTAAVVKEWGLLKKSLPRTICSPLHSPTANPAWRVLSDVLRSLQPVYMCVASEAGWTCSRF